MGSDQLGNYNRGFQQQHLQFNPKSTMGPDPYAGAAFEQLNNALQLPTQYANSRDRVTRRAENLEAKLAEKRLAEYKLKESQLPSQDNYAAYRAGLASLRPLFEGQEDIQTLINRAERTSLETEARYGDEQKATDLSRVIFRALGVGDKSDASRDVAFSTAVEEFGGDGASAGDAVRRLISDRMDALGIDPDEDPDVQDRAMLKVLRFFDDPINQDQRRRNAESEITRKSALGEQFADSLNAYTSGESDLDRVLEAAEALNPSNTEQADAIIASLSDATQNNDDQYEGLLEEVKRHFKGNGVSDGDLNNMVDTSRAKRYEPQLKKWLNNQSVSTIYGIYEQSGKTPTEMMEALQSESGIHIMTSNISEMLRGAYDRAQRVDESRRSLSDESSRFYKRISTGTTNSTDRAILFDAAQVDMPDWKSNFGFAYAMGSRFRNTRAQVNGESNNWTEVPEGLIVEMKSLHNSNDPEQLAAFLGLYQGLGGARNPRVFKDTEEDQRMLATAEYLSLKYGVRVRGNTPEVEKNKGPALVIEGGVPTLSGDGLAALFQTGMFRSEQDRANLINDFRGLQGLYERGGETWDDIPDEWKDEADEWATGNGGVPVGMTKNVWNILVADSFNMSQTTESPADRAESFRTALRSRLHSLNYRQVLNEDITELTLGLMGSNDIRSWMYDPYSRLSDTIPFLRLLSLAAEDHADYPKNSRVLPLDLNNPAGWLVRVFKDENDTQPEVIVIPDEYLTSPQWETAQKR